jgi:hypothetical protein
MTQKNRPFFSGGRGGELAAFPQPPVICFLRRREVLACPTYAAVLSKFTVGVAPAYTKLQTNVNIIAAGSTITMNNEGGLPKPPRPVVICGPSGVGVSFLLLFRVHQL